MCCGMCRMVADGSRKVLALLREETLRIEGECESWRWIDGVCVLENGLRLDGRAVRARWKGLFDTWD